MDMLEKLEMEACSRAVAAYIKVVRRRKPSSAEGTRRGRAREGDSPLFRGVGGLPLDFFWALLCAFFMNSGTDFSHDFLLENIWNQMIFFLLFSSACFFDTISPMFTQALTRYFKHWSLVVLQRVVFSKRYTMYVYTSVFSIRTPVKDAGFI